MRLKYAITIGDPKSAQIVAVQSRSTGNSHLSRDDIVTALGLTQSRCRTGLALIYAKYTKDPYSAEMALAGLQQYATATAKKYFSESGSGFRIAISIMAMLALEEYCRTADTPGAKCLCGGRGQTRDLKKSKKNGFPVYQECKRCKGTGLRPLTQTRCHHAIIKHFPVSQSTYSRYWRPFYDDLLSWCYRQESLAEDSYNLITSLNPRFREMTGNEQV
ncbi:antitermination protein [Trabulsiella odontotermitis]|uniref:antitermination protein Q n=1 Tax=Trabulsiella odontotermitis TaxID=379893 RepID=UPI003AC8C6D8